MFMKLSLIAFAIIHASSGQTLLTPMSRPNRLSFWKDSGFQEMVGPLHLPTDASQKDTIEVWLKLPDTGKVTAQLINDSLEERYTLVYPPGTIADRVEYQKGDPSGVGDVRGARIDENGATRFHVYETVPKTDFSMLQGFEWPRVGDVADVVAGDALAWLFYPSAESKVRNQFRELNHCGKCHQENAPIPSTTLGDFRYESDSRGFFQPLTVLSDEVTVRNHRPRDLNADDPFVTVYCENQPVKALTNASGARWYECAKNIAPVGKLDIVAALKAKDTHAQALCQARRYFFEHMDDSARAAFGAAFRECQISE